MRAAQAVSVQLPQNAQVLPPNLESSAVTSPVTISARTVAGDVGPLPVDVQPGRPTFHGCLVTVGGVAGLEVRLYVLGVSRI